MTENKKNENEKKEQCKGNESEGQVIRLPIEKVDFAALSQLCLSHFSL